MRGLISTGFYEMRPVQSSPVRQRKLPDGAGCQWWKDSRRQSDRIGQHFQQQLPRDGHLVQQPDGRQLHLRMDGNKGAVPKRMAVSRARRIAAFSSRNEIQARLTFHSSWRVNI